MRRPGLRLCLDSVDGHPAADTAAARVILDRVAARDLPATLRLSQPPRVVAFSSRDTRHPGFPAAATAARQHGFEAIVRLAGGRPAVFTPATIAFALAEPAEDPVTGIGDRFATMAAALSRALRAIGVDARVGEVPGEYCPGEWSVNARGQVKLAGVGQRVLKTAAHTGGVVVVAGRDDINRVLTPVQEAMSLPWDPAATGAVTDEVVGTSWEQVRDAIVSAFEATHDLEAWSLDETTRRAALRLADDHVVGATGSSR